MATLQPNKGRGGNGEVKANNGKKSMRKLSPAPPARSMTTTTSNPVIARPSSAPDEDDMRRDDSLYENTNMHGYIGRRVEPEDLAVIKRFLTDEEYEFYRIENPHMLFERCCYSIAISEAVEADRIVAAALFDDKPIDPDVRTYGKVWKNTPELQKMVPLNTFYMRLFTGTPEVSPELLLTQIFAFTFNSCSTIRYIIVECPNLETTGPFLFCEQVKDLRISPCGMDKKLLLIFERDVLFPPLVVREGRENDLDDLAPLLPMDHDTMMKEFGKSVLTDIIALSEKKAQSIVGEWNKEAVGILLVSADLDYDMLNRLFYLEPFHGLFKPHEKDEIPFDPKRDSLLVSPDEKHPYHRFVKPKLPKYYGIPNALAIRLFNIDKKFTMRTVDLFREAFRFFPNREYLVATIPHGSREPAWLQYFVRVVPRVDRNCPFELFVTHKSYFTSKLKVRRGRTVDIPSVMKLTESLKEQNKIADDFKRAVCCKKQYCYVTELVNQTNPVIVGMALLSDEPESQIYEVNYQLDDHTYYPLHTSQHHAYIHHLIIYPIFQPFARVFVKEIMRFMDKTCIYQRLYPTFSRNPRKQHQTLLNNLDDWIPVVPRKRIHYNFLNLSDDPYDLERLPPPFVTDYKDPFSVIYFGKKFAYDRKVCMNSKIVFVGASETTLSCIERLISSGFRYYKRMTIIDPTGLPGQLYPSPARDTFFSLKKGGTSMSFNSYSEWIQRLGLHHWVNVVRGKVTRIVRDRRFVVVDKEKVVPYDILILAPGHQFQRLDCPEPEIDDPNFLGFKMKSLKTKQEVNFAFKRNTPKPKNVFTINSEAEAETSLRFIRTYAPLMKKKKVVIFGFGLNVYACANALLRFGVAPKRIVILNAANEGGWATKIGLHANVKGPVGEELAKAGVQMLNNYEFSQWDFCPDTGFIKRCYFWSAVEKEPTISYSTLALFCFRYKRVNDELVSALSEASILFQDGIIIDEHFRTNDENIYAAGPATTYKKILMAAHHDHIYCQSEEVGHKLAGMLIERIGSEGGGAAELETMKVPNFCKPFVRAIELPGWWFLYLRSPGAPPHVRCSDPTMRCDINACTCTAEMVTGSVNPSEDPRQRFFKIQLDDRSRVVGLECMSKDPFSASNFMGVYGQHEVMLNKMMERLERGETKDLYDHFCQPWFGAFCIDRWHHFLAELKDVYRNHDIGGDRKMADFICDYVENLDNPESIDVDPNIIRSIWDSSGLKNEVELRFLAFLKFHRYSIPMYAGNDYVEKLLEERSTDPLFQPKRVKL